ncbi:MULTISPECIES: M20 family metallopeptidase [Asticcacaulis]|uniref:M20 metallopeptidase family protein n=1 Tax=Asticcacaulis TaxID=76890 RepID=UPI001AE6C8A1|nr:MULTISPECIES: amidohydrolase [Asticcacaulis]MBP2158875.1 hippurate hydrolase [Asticcacaulis solisilvae]MDR6799920.1 hippurate hydrolase [Asticcacaulis sp. BE141]
MALPHGLKVLLPVLALVAAAPAMAQPDYAAAIKADYDKDLGALWDHFHRNPELSHMEVKTAARMAKELRATGAEVTEKVGGTGVVAVLRNGPGPVVLLRADMDGLPVKEASGLSNMSVARQVGVDGIENPVMHACGHDTHIVGLVATARRLVAMKDRWSGTVVMIGQPAEERIAGAKAMLADGLYTRFPKPDYALAWHVNSLLPTGTVSASEDIQYSSSDSIDITVPGVGAHGAAPHTGKDPVYIASQLVIALQGIISREKPPLKPGVITVGAFHAGTKHNIISDHADLQVTVRANDEDTRAMLIAAIRRVSANVGRLNGLPEDKLPVVKVIEGTPVTKNDPALTRRLNAVMVQTLGEEAVVPFEQKTMGAEDFAYFVQADHKVPGYYFAVGGTPRAALDAAEAGGPPVPSHHSPLFKIAPEPAIVTGATAMTAAVLELMKKP